MKFVKQQKISYKTIQNITIINMESIVIVGNAKENVKQLSKVLIPNKN